MNANRDGFIIRDENDVEQHFMPCDKDGSERDRVEMGLLRKLRDNWTYADTRWPQ